MEFQDYDLLVTPDLTIRATSDAGEVQDRLQLERSEISLALQLIERTQTNENLLKTLGGRLYGALFPPRVLAHFKSSQARAEAQGSGLRLRLTFEPPEWLSLPWEFLYEADTDTFLANSPQTAISHYLPVPFERRDLPSAQRPLKILLVISAPLDRLPLDGEGEAELISAALESHRQAGQVEIDVLADATLRAVNQKLREKAYNVFHFIGHADFTDDQVGQVYLVKAEDGNSREVDEETFSNFFLGNRSLGLVVLNACQGAALSTAKAFTGLAPRLVRRGLPAVIAMRYPIADGTARLFADEFYRTLALGWPVDAAIQTTRNAISMETGLDRPDFATPVLFMRARDGLILSGL